MQPSNFLSLDFFEFNQLSICSKIDHRQYIICVNLFDVFYYLCCLSFSPLGQDDLPCFNFSHYFNKLIENDNLVLFLSTHLVFLSGVSCVFFHLAGLPFLLPIFFSMHLTLWIFGQYQLFLSYIVLWSKNIFNFGFCVVECVSKSVPRRALRVAGTSGTYCANLRLKCQRGLSAIEESSW